MTVHPSTTSRSASADTIQIALQAHAYLSLLTSTFGSITANLTVAFAFKRAQAESTDFDAFLTHGNSRKRRKASRDTDASESQSPADSDDATKSPTTSDSGGEKQINNALANNGSVFTAAEGFWHVVGWALNCSVRHPRRWLYWKHWLQLILSVLQAELDASRSNTVPSLGGSYLREADPSTRSGLRRILRAIFADGSDGCLAEFHEVWPGETNPPKETDRKGVARSRKQLNLDEGEFGDYWDDDMDDSAAIGVTIKEEGGAGSKRTSGRTMRQPGKYKINMDLDDGLERSQDEKKDITPETKRGIDAFGGVESLHVRRQILAWSNAFLQQHPFSKTSLHDFLELTAEFLRPCSLPVFTHFITPTLTSDYPAKSTNMSHLILARLHMALLNTLLASNEVPVFHPVLPSQELVSYFYLTYDTKSHNLVDFAKAALVIEALIRILWRNRVLTSSPEFHQAIQNGLSVRSKKAETILRKRGHREEDIDVLNAFEQANRRLRMIVATLT